MPFPGSGFCYLHFCILTRFQKFTRKLHLWLGLTCGVIVSFSGLTGSLYTWQPELTAYFNPELLQVKLTKVLDEKDVMKTVSVLVEERGESISKIHLPYREQETISLNYLDGKTEYFHPLTGASLGEKSSSILFFEQLLVYHRTLGIPEYGHHILGTSAIIFALILLSSGVFIWWDIFRKRISEGFRLRWNFRKKIFNYDLHKIFGIYFFLPLFIIAISGGFFTYNSTYKSLLKVFDQMHATSTKMDLEKSSSYSTLQEMLADFSEVYHLRAIYFPNQSDEVYRLRLIEHRQIHSGLRKTKEMEWHPEGGLITLSDYTSDPASLRIVGQFYPIHIGEFLGLIGRVLVFLSGLAPAVLLITGWRIFRSKKA